jgi:putative transposase
MFKGHCFPPSIILHAVYLKLRFTLSYRDIEELLRMRGVKVDHATIQRWVFKFTPMVEAQFRKRKREVGNSWRMDETYVKIQGQWMYLYRAVDKDNQTVDFYLSPRGKRYSAQAFLIKAINQNGLPRLINIDKSGANRAGIKVYNKRNRTKIESRSCKYLNNIVEQDHRFIKRRIGPMLGFKSFESARRTLAGIELVRMLKKGQLESPKSTAFKSFCALVA